jgi:CheY-like chemotaxis protein
LRAYSHGTLRVTKSKGFMTDQKSRMPLQRDGRRPIVVLLVDDQPFVCAAVGRLLASEPDIELHACHDPKRAVAMSEELEPTVILQDLVMPEIDGFTLIGAFRRNPSTMGVPIIALSGNDDANTRARALDAGANGYLVKLPPKDQLIACLRQSSGAAGTMQDNGHSVEAGTDAVATKSIDSTVIARLHDLGADDFVRTLVGQFLEEAGSRLTMLKDAAARSDTSGLKVSAHSLKGSSKMMGAMRLAGLCVELETYIEGQTSEQSPTALLAALDQELVRVRRALFAELSAAGPAPQPPSSKDARRIQD